jgi:hypothetical protein
VTTVSTSSGSSSGLAVVLIDTHCPAVPSKRKKSTSSGASMASIAAVPSVVIVSAPSNESFVGPASGRMRASVIDIGPVSDIAEPASVGAGVLPHAATGAVSASKIESRSVFVM